MDDILRDMNAEIGSRITASAKGGGKVKVSAITDELEALKARYADALVPDEYFAAIDSLKDKIRAAHTSKTKVFPKVLSGKEPPVPKGHTRLYRGEHPISQKSNIWDDYGKLSDSGQGGWFTKNKDYADYFRETQGKGANIVYIDLPTSMVENFRLSPPGYRNVKTILGDFNEPSYFIPELRKTPRNPKPAGVEIIDDTISVEKAQRMKVATYQELRGKYGELKSVDIEARKTAARALKEEIQNLVPEVGDLNRAEGDVILLRKAIDAASKRISNKDVISIMDPLAGGAGTALTGSASGGWLTLIARRVLGDPTVKTRLAAVLKRGGPRGAGVTAIQARTLGYLSGQSPQRDKSTNYLFP